MKPNITVDLKYDLSQLKKSRYSSYKRSIQFFLMVLLIISSSFNIVVATSADIAVDLAFPLGGEKISGMINLEWTIFFINFVQYSSHLYFSEENEDEWHKINDIELWNALNFTWDTRILDDGKYQIKIVIVTKEDYITSDTSDYFVIDNDKSNVKIVDMIVLDSSMAERKAVRNAEDIRIEAFFDNADDYILSDISADFSVFGFDSYENPDFFNGFMAAWNLTNVRCQTSDGIVHISVQIGDIEEYSMSILIDNTEPQLSIARPTTGIYIFNKRIVPFPRCLCIGALTLEINSDDLGGVSKTDIYIDSNLEYSVNGDISIWEIDRRLFGVHMIRIVVYDSAGNKAESSIIINIFNFF